MSGVVGWWNLENRKLKITLSSHTHQELISGIAASAWNDLTRIEYW